MGMQLRYMGEFVSVGGRVWRCEIWQKAETPYGEVGELTLEGEEALVIEWPEVPKEQPLCGSTATLRIESPGDRTYADLYAIEPGSIMLEAYMDGSLQWRGTLDAEFYEEPYERASQYTVTLTFSDFGAMGRMKYGLTGLQTLEGLARHALESVGLGGMEIHEGMITTCFPEGTPMSLGSVSVRSDNFIDEEGEPMTIKEALEGALQPLGLRMAQRGGKIYVYDLNGLYRDGGRREIYWSGDSQTMGVDKVANNVKVTFSPYSSGTILSGEAEYGGKYGADRANFAEADPEDEEYGEYYSYLPEYYAGLRTAEFDAKEASFSIFLGEGTGLAYVNPAARYFHISPFSGSGEADGVAWALYGGGAKAGGGMSGIVPNPGMAKLNAGRITKGSHTYVMKSKRAFLPTLSASDRKKFMIRVSMEMLLDARYNPFTDSKSDNDGTGNHTDNYWDNDNDFKVCTAWAFVPVLITMYDSEGNAVSHYTNKATTESGARGVLGVETGRWEQGAAMFGDAWLAYYDPEDLRESAGIRGWKTNRHNIGRPDTDSRRPAMWLMYDSFKQMGEGELIPYPDEGGYLEIAVGEGVRCFDYAEEFDFDATNRWDRNGLYDKVRWLLYKAPKAEVVRDNLSLEEAGIDDVEYRGSLNPQAKDDLEIDTICGTAERAIPTARGALMRTDTGEQITTLKRAGVEDHPERLLIGTLYSQYANRRTRLDGEARLEAGAVRAYTEANQGDKIFMLVGEKHDCIKDTMDAALVELRPDEYEAEEAEA